MKYTSTRGGVQGLTFEDALLSGYAQDGGMILPETIPRVSADTIRAWSRLSYTQLVKEILPLFISAEEIPRSDLDAIVDRAAARFTVPEMVRVADLSGDLHVLELFHGPTLAFKDLALTCVGQLLEYFLKKRQKHVTALVGTSGDTGSAAIESVRGLKWVDIVVLLPKGRTSRVQELQMTTVKEDNVHVYRVDGTSDDLDEPIRQCFRDNALVTKHNLISINSINWARILVQIAHYFYSYYKLNPSCEGEVEIVCPTGACGNVTGGVIAREMGLPVRLVCAVNANDIVERTLTTGDYSIIGEVKETLAPAMNIQVPYNLERMFYCVNGQDSAQIRAVMASFEKDSKAQIPRGIMDKIQITSRSYGDDAIRATMKRCWEENQYLLCPHSAVGVAYHYSHSPPTIPRMCVATASPAKFEEAVLSAGLTPQPTEGIKALDSMETVYKDMNAGEDWEAILKAKIEDIYKKL